MSYFCYDDTNQNINEERENIIMNEATKDTVKKKRDHRGELNPHFGHIQTQESKDRISKSQSERYEMIRKLVRKGMQKPIDEARVREICNQVIDAYFKRNLIEVKGNNKKPMNINL